MAKIVQVGLIFFLSIGALGCSSFTFAADNPMEICDLRDRICRLDVKTRKYLPYITASGDQPDQLILPLPRFEFPGVMIALDMPDQSHLFVNGRFILSTFHRQVCRFDLDSLYRLYPTDTLQLGIFFQEKNANRFRPFLESSSDKPDLLSADIYRMQHRPQNSGFTEFIIMGFLLAIAYLAYLFNYDQKLFRLYLNVRNFFMRPETDDLLERNRPFAGSDMLFVILESVLLGFFVYLILISNREEDPFIHFGLGKGMLIWSLISLMILTWNIIKYIFMRNLAGILQIREVVRIQFFETNRLTLFFLMIYLVVSIFLLFSLQVNFQSVAKFLLSSLIILAFARVGLVSLKILNYVPVKKIYIISYLCSSELIPVIIGLKIIKDSSAI